MPITETTWTPPEHFALASIDEDDKSVFDADTLQASADDKELWLIRIPDNLTAADLNGVRLAMPNDTSASTIDIGDGKYNVQTMSADASTAIGGREMRGMHCLVPSQDKLVLAPLPFAKYITLTHAVDIPSSKPLAKEIQAKVTEKRPHPNGLKMQFPLSCISTKSETSSGSNDHNKMAINEKSARVETDRSEPPKKKHKSHSAKAEISKKRKKKSKH